MSIMRVQHWQDIASLLLGGGCLHCVAVRPGLRPGATTWITIMLRLFVICCTGISVVARSRNWRQT